MKVILLNGPRGVGKDTAAAALMAPNRHTFRVTQSLKLRVLATYKIPAEQLPFWDGIKDVSCAEFDGQSFREVLIDVANAERKTDPYAIAKQWAKDLELAEIIFPYQDPEAPQIVIVPDVRFFEEFIVACDLVGGKNVLLARVYRDGYGWTGDVGGYIRTDIAVFGNGEISLYNNWDRDGFELEAKVLVGMWLKQNGG